MSLILEALKKSEAKRRLGEAPDLGTPFAGSAPRRGPLPFILAAIVVVAGVGWWSLRTPATTDKPATPPVAAQAQAARTAPAAKPPTAAIENTHPPAPVMPGTGANVAATDRPAKPVAAPAVSNKPDPFVAGPNQSRPTPGFGNKKSPARPAETQMAGQRTLPPPPTTPAPATPTIAAASAAKAPAPSTASSTPATVPAEAPVAGEKTLPPPATKAGAATPADSPKTAALAAKAAASDAPPAATAGAQPYYELPFSVRKDLPALRLNMHVYAADPTQRFVILNNSRMAEGDSQDDLALREIRPDGVVLEFKGQRFFYPRDGL